MSIATSVAARCLAWSRTAHGDLAAVGHRQQIVQVGGHDVDHAKLECLLVGGGFGVGNRFLGQALAAAGRCASAVRTVASSR